MKKNYFILLLLTSLVVTAQTEWTGAKITFTKAPNADWTMPANQDFITNNVIITRQNNQGLFNIAQESSHQNNNGNGSSPADTEWAFGSISDGINNLTFTTWGVAHSDAGGGNPPSLIGQDMVLHLITDDIYLDIKLLSWGVGGGGGGSFSYERSTETLSANQFDESAQIKVFPNPSTKIIQVSGLENEETYTIYNILGKQVKRGNISSNGFIEVSDFPTGVYLLKLGNNNTLKFLKK